MSDQEERRIIQFEKLNTVGKAIFVAGAAVRTTADLIEKALDKAADFVVEAEKAFKQGLDANVDDAKIIDEQGWEEE